MRIGRQLSRLVGCFLLAPWEAAVFALKPGATTLTKRVTSGYQYDPSDLMGEAVRNGRIDALNAVFDACYPIRGTHALDIIQRCAEIKRTADVQTAYQAAIIADNLRVMRLLRPLLDKVSIQADASVAAEAGNLRALTLIHHWRVPNREIPYDEIDFYTCRDAASNGHFHIIKFLHHRRVLDPIAVFEGIFDSYDNLTAQKAAERGILSNVRKIFQFILNVYDHTPAIRHVYEFNDPEITRMFNEYVMFR
ncbi:MAG: hypothetical protein KGL39_09470 [Patescibacteria group bacterium]|nr:hypothetical protein [Patescibacteria group bacterium]